MEDNNMYELHSKVCIALVNPQRIEIIEILNEWELDF